MRDESSALPLVGLVAGGDVCGLEYNVKFMSTAPDPNESSLSNVLELRLNTGNATFRFLLASNPIADDGVPQ